MIKEIDADAIFNLGWSLGWLEFSANVSPTWDIISTALNPLCSFSKLKGLEFIGSEAQGQLSSLGRKYKSPGRRLGIGDLETLKEMIQNWNGKLSEISKSWVCSVPETHIDIHKLASGGRSFFTEKEWNSFSELEQKGFSEAASCLLGNNFTACEFITLRTVESILRRWYQKKTGKDITNVFWGNVIESLDSEYPTKKPPEISALFHFKNRRNAIAHPDCISDEAESSATYHYAINIFKSIYKYLNE